MSLLIVWLGPVVILKLVIKAYRKKRSVDIGLVDHNLLHFDLVVLVVLLVDRTGLTL